MEGRPLLGRREKGSVIVIERGLGHQLERHVHLDYPPEGVVCTMNIPVPGSQMDSLLAGRGLLVVEDETMVLMMIESMLDDLGCRNVTSVGTVEKG